MHHKADKMHCLAQVQFSIVPGCVRCINIIAPMTNNQCYYRELERKWLYYRSSERKLKRIAIARTKTE